LISLPNPDDKTIQNLEQLFSRFIWNKKPPKINRKQLAKLYDEGGLQMVNINNYINSLKLSWIRRFVLQQNSGNIFPQKYFLNEIITLGPNNQGYTPRVDNQFWADVILAWERFGHNFYQKFEPTNFIDILSQPLWGNPWINIEYIRPWYTKGIHYVRDIIKPDGILKSIIDLKSEYSINITFLDYHRLAHAIIPRWLNIIANKADMSFPCIPPQLYAVLSVKRGCSTYSNILSYNAEDNTFPSAQNKWKRDLALNDNTNATLWNKIYKLPFIITLDTNLRYFQYKILHRIIPTNKYLTLIKIKDNDSCSFCEAHIETLLHLFVECECVSHVWRELQLWMVSCVYINIQTLEPQDIIFGKLDEDSIFNYILLLAKFVIFRSKLAGKRPTFAAVKAYLKYVMEI